MRSADHAAELAGGYEALAERLGVPREQVIDWALGLARPDAASLLCILEVILHETQKLSRAVFALEPGQQVLTRAQKSTKTT